MIWEPRLLRKPSWLQKLFIIKGLLQRLKLLCICHWLLQVQIPTSFYYSVVIGTAVGFPSVILVREVRGSLVN